ncbi:MAG: ABC transporter ATP-binding protein, partial [Bacteroidales bacterium]|nr:ABC transporter ATP-binding protein [Bacteroidales bacterium]
GKEDPTLKIGQSNDLKSNISSLKSDNYVWALKDINLEVKQGEVLGIIGKNGAGKSTLLKLLSRVTGPTTGQIKVKGRIASLLEVGTGFHGELTGRENIFLNGAIMGMTKNDIRQKLDEIIDFAGVAKYIDTPVKRYSSGMYVRLGFSVAAHLEPDILVVDEVLAVGDAEFQKKAIGKMQDISSGGGRTVLFVSHNMTAVKNLCKTGIMLKNGTVDYSGEINEVVNCYLSDESVESILNNYWIFENAPGNESIKVKSAFVLFDNERITIKSSFEIVTEFWNQLENTRINVSMVIWDVNQNPVFNITTNSVLLKKGLNKAVFHIPQNLMNDGIYKVQNYFVIESSTPVFIHDNACSFEIFEDRLESSWHGKWIGAVRPTFVKSDIFPIESEV